MPGFLPPYYNKKKPHAIFRCCRMSSVHGTDGVLQTFTTVNQQFHVIVLFSAFARKQNEGNSFISSNLIHNSYIDYIKLNASICFERHPPIFRRSMSLIEHVCSLWYSHSLQVAVLCTCIKLELIKELYYDARPNKPQNEGN